MSSQPPRVVLMLCLALAIFLCAGCPAPPKRVEKVTYIPTDEELRPPQTNEPPKILMVQTNLPPPTNASAQKIDAAVITNAPPPAQIPEKRAVPLGLNGIAVVSVQKWFIENHQQYQIKVYPPSIYKVEMPQGNLSLELGNRFARWNGVNIGLGFAPSLADGKLAMHSVDLAKNIWPLLTDIHRPEKLTWVLALDPGHGGENPGAKSASKSSWEKDYTLDWALRIQRLLANSRWRVVLTRTNDTHIELNDRVALADAANADLFVSLHFNSLPPSPKGSEEAGIETYCLTPAGMPSNIVREFEDDLSKVYPNNAFDDENFLFACRFHSSMLKATGRKDRGVRRARFMTVLREQKRPAVLLEGGYLSNYNESLLIGDPAFRQKLAQAVVSALPR